MVLYQNYTKFKLRNIVSGRIVYRGMEILHGRYADNLLGGGNKRVLPDYSPTKTSHRHRLHLLT